ncbi:hypothetical protein LTR99_007751 [Exophiala xenobiotica]|uniref:Enoyl reductase (ER) domain-containing protein n=1 Tax=Vermiconidia calcicola TaxID=1690605 RepID=A0AAV9Q4X1_9PEZI|nr:hypothetical protein LTR96_000278 [Exophiala xenobiotica]KAK5535278.1 hypothetical protein LTR25_006286 [Vermiconidia calcicola]KAK5546779.1 hypothetical protein LTR23_003150 [Chaetothyriales sp. CCFEE 6169]KAK5298062.1 hypothetical protein LTR99_007751 [Exophiala xenobiotica]KAK5323202.1 hypothetical protein LTR93_005255 [Exophiala xenobiotica]
MGEYHASENPNMDDQYRFPVHTEALVVDSPKADFVMKPIVLNDMREDELLVEMTYTGICHTDIVLQQGLLPMVDFPAIFGHEGAGKVLAIGSEVKDKSIKIGDSVLLSFNVCGECRQCRAGHPAYCHNHPQINHNAVRKDRSTPAASQDGSSSIRSQYFGHSSFSKISVVAERSVVKCPQEEILPSFAPLGCGFQTGAGTVLNVLKPTKDDSIAVFGLGAVGLAALMAAKYLDAKQIIAVDLVPEKLNLAKEFGATATINPKDVPDVVKATKELTNGGVDFAIDCTGVVAVIEQCIEALGPLGVAAGVGVPPVGRKIQIDPLTFLLENKRYIGVIEGDSVPSEFIPKLVEMQQEGLFPVEKLCRIYDIADFDVAIADLKAGKVIKPVIEF